MSMMTLPEISKTLQGELKDEIDGCKQYYNMGMSADDMRHYNLSHYLYEMAKDEYTHAKFIRDYMKENHVEVTDSEESAFAEIEDLICRKFR